LTEEESARLLLELRKQNYSKPIIGETTIIEQKVLELADLRPMAFAATSVYPFPLPLLW
jgi:hypothetical protein